MSEEMRQDMCEYCKETDYFPDWCELYQKWCILKKPELKNECKGTKTIVEDN